MSLPPTVGNETDPGSAVNHVGARNGSYAGDGAAQVCKARNCDAYDPNQLWTLDAETRQLISANYTASINAQWLTHKVPGPARRCLSSIAAADMAGSRAGKTEVWAGPLEGGAYVAVLHNRGGKDGATVSLDLDLLDEPNRFFTYASLPTAKRLGFATVVPPLPDFADAFNVTDLLTGETTVATKHGTLAAPLPKGASKIFKLTPA